MCAQWVGDYEIDRSRNVGRGGQARVYIGTHIETKQEVAIREVKLTDENTLNLCKREIENIEGLESPFIVKYLHWEIDYFNQLAYFVQEYVPGGSMAAFIMRSGPIDEYTANRWMKEIVLGMDEVWSHDIIHRDIKPENIFLTAANHSAHIKIGDFGLSKTAKYSKFEDAVGTELYMAPELKNKGICSFAADIWSLGLVYFELLYGRQKEFNAESISQTLQSASKFARTNILAMLRDDPEDRLSRKQLVNRFRLLKRARIHTDANCKTNAMTNLLTSTPVTVKKFRDPHLAAEITALHVSVPGLVSYISSWTSDEHSFLELEENLSLESFVQRHGPICEFIAAKWIEQLLKTTQLLYLRGLVHTNLSPKSVYLEKDDFNTRILIGDLERCVNKRERAIPPVPLSDYTAPELSLGLVSPEVDSWGLGCVFRYMLQGEVTDCTLVPGMWRTLIAGLLVPENRLTVGQAALLANKARKEVVLGSVPERMNQFPKEYETATKSCKTIKSLLEMNRVDAAHSIARLLLSIVANVARDFGGCERFLRELGAFVERQQALAEYQLSRPQPLPELRETISELIEQVDLDDKSQHELRKNLEKILGSWVQGEWDHCTDLGWRRVCGMYEVNTEFEPIRVMKNGVVIKQIRLDGDQEIAQVRSEIKQLMELNSLYLVKYQDFDVIEESGYIVMSQAAGPSLQAVGKVRLGTALRWVSQLIQVVIELDKRNMPIRRLSSGDVLLARPDLENADVQLLYKVSGPMATESTVQLIGNLLQEISESPNSSLRDLLVSSEKDTLVQLGITLAQRFRFQRPLRRESGGDVLLALDEISGDTVEAKFAQQQMEADVLKRVRGPFVRNVLEVQQVSGRLYVYMEHCGGGLLAEFIQTSGALCAEAAKRWMKQLLQAVSDIHAQGYVHLNISASSILLTSADLGGTAKLADFSQARPNFMPEERVSDIVSLGTVFYHLLEGFSAARFSFEYSGERSVDLLGKMLRGEYNAAESLQHLFFSGLRPAFDQSRVAPSNRPVVRQVCEFLGRLIEASNSLLARNCVDVAVKVLNFARTLLQQVTEYSSPELQIYLNELVITIDQDYWNHSKLASAQMKSAVLQDLKSLLELRDCGEFREVVAQAAEIEAAGSQYKPLPYEDETDMIAAKLGLIRLTILGHSLTSTTLLVEDFLSASVWVKKYVMVKDGFEVSCHPSFVDVKRVPAGDGLEVWHLPYLPEGSIASWIASRGALTEAEFRGPAARLLHLLWQAHESGMEHGDLQPDKVLLKGAGFIFLHAAEKRRKDLHGVAGVLYYMLRGEELSEGELSTEEVAQKLLGLPVSDALKDWLWGMLAPDSRKALCDLIDDPYFQQLRFVPMQLPGQPSLISKGTDLCTNTTVCVKEVPLKDDESIKVYIAKTALTKVECPYLVKYLFVSSPRGRATVMMESAEEDLEQYLKRTTVSPDMAKGWMVQLHQAAAALWKRNLVHGAICLAHILVCNGQLRLSGLHMCADPKYVEAGSRGSVAGDIWALGVVFLELATGICKKVDDDCLAKAPSDLQVLLRSMLVVDTTKRISPEEIETLMQACHLVQILSARLSSS